MMNERFCFITAGRTLLIVLAYYNGLTHLLLGAYSMGSNRARWISVQTASKKEKRKVVRTVCTAINLSFSVQVQHVELVNPHSGVFSLLEDPASSKRTRAPIA